MEKITLLERIFGTSDTNYVIALLIFAIVGVAISLLMHSTERDPEDETNPTKFNILFLLKDNAKRIALSVLLILVSIKFSNQLFGIDMTEFNALLVGFSYDKLGQYLKKKDILVGEKK